jgi:hypothetical protein
MPKVPAAPQESVAVIRQRVGASFRSMIGYAASRHRGIAAQENGQRIKYL